VIGNDAGIAVGGLQGHLELNVFKPMLIATLLSSIRLLADAARSFRLHCVDGLEPDRRRIDELVGRSLMLVTALAPRLGYDAASKVALTAHKDGKTLREVVVEMGLLAGEEFDRLVRPEDMVRPS
jgi:fumarate hydratase class II